MNKIESAIGGWLVGAATAIAAFNYADYRGTKMKEQLEKSVPIGQYTEYIDLKNDGTYPIMRVIYNTGEEKNLLYAGDSGLGDMTKKEIESIPPTYPRVFKILE